MMRWNLLTLGLLLTSMSYGQNVCGPQALQVLHSAHHHDAACPDVGCPGLQGTGVDSHTSVGTPHWYSPAPGPRSAIINLEFGPLFPDEAKPAVERAVDIWSQSIETVIPVNIQAIWDSLPPNILAQAAPYEVLHDFEDAPEANRQYAIALANQLAGQDLNPAAPDMVVKFAEDTPWYLGLDGQVPDSVYDMVTVALHEMGHGLGYLGSANHNGNSGFIGFQGIPFIFDHFVEESDQTSLLDYVSGTVTFGEVLESDALYWGGENGSEALGVGRPRLYAPTNWAPGASFSHLRENSYPEGNANSLMTPFLNTAESIHTPGPVALGMMQDMGWSLPPVLCSLLDVVTLTQTGCNPLTNTYTQVLQVTYENAPETGNLTVNGVAFPITGSPQTVSLTNLTSDGAPVNVDVSFSENLDCSLTAPALFTAPESCCVLLRLAEVNPEAKTVTIRNVADCEGGLSGQVIKSGGTQAFLTDLLPPGVTLAAGATLTISWPDWPNNAAGGDLTLHDQVGAYDDYVQWGTPGNVGQVLANIYNLWTPNTFLEGLPPYTYEGDPYANPAEQGVEYWSAVPFPCAVLSMTAGATSGCNPVGNVFTQELIVEFQSPPPAGDVILVNDSMVVYDGANPWNVVLALPASGTAVDLTVTVMGEPTCTGTLVGEVLAPEECGCPTDLNNGGFVDVTDLLLFLTDYGCMSGCTADFNGDDIVNVNDLLIFLTSYGDSCN
ncbi:MAG: hypothetical protein CBC05_06305 [Crocinitomicaceae bacterium TMED45]|nr:MAG: hypothetical protein CBC05_06305 [Crocinitomicaceae bacterium TMED45]